VGLRAWWFLRRPYTYGVKCIVRDERGRVLFVRHTYGDRAVWEVPGGGRRRWEDPEVAVRREMREELGIELVGLKAVGELEILGHHKQTLLHCFAAFTGGAPIHLAAAEIARAQWAPPGAPPRPLSPDAAALVALARE
jgi:ADP-ribose pyrophosphatase YjhB (NUDIX family)